MDSGNEYKGMFESYLDEHHVHIRHGELRNHYQFGVIDSFSKTLKAEIHKWMVHEDRTDWTTQLDHIVHVYNTRDHVALLNDASPAEAVVEGSIAHKEARLINSVKHLENELKPKPYHRFPFQVGDFVRHKLDRGIGAKDTDKWSHMVWKVRDVLSGGFTCELESSVGDIKKFASSKLAKVAFTQERFENQTESAIDRAKRLARQRRKLAREGL